MTDSPAGARGEQPPAGEALPTQRQEPAGSRPVPEELAARLAANGELTAEEVAALARLDDGTDDCGGSWDDDRGAGHAVPADSGPVSEPPSEWLALPGEEHAGLLADGPVPAEVLDAGFTRGYASPGATGFAAGGPLDVMLPGPDLAWHAAQARRRGLDALSDDELCGLQGAARRLGSWAYELEIAAVTELDGRRVGADGRPGEHVTDEIAAAHTLTHRSADALLGLARNLARLPQITGLLAAGIVDRARAAIIADRLALLGDADCAAVENAIASRAGAMTTGRLGAAVDRAIKAHDPQAAIHRREQAQKDARVECWAEAAGTSAIAGRDLAPAGVIAADKTLDADARWLKQHGAPGAHDQLRAAALIARLTGRPLPTLLPQPPVSTPTSGAPGTADAPIPATPGAAADAPIPATPGAAADVPTPATATPGPAAGAPTPATPGPAAGAPTPATPATPGGWLAGSVNLTMPASAWLGLSDAPGDAGGFGALDAATCRELATALAAGPATRWCVTLTDPAGRPIGHGCARAGPGPPGAGRRCWLATVTITPIETGTCAHRRQCAGYQPSPTLRHLIKIRSRRCGFPGCRRPAVRCDDDHTIPYDQGGRTCECNLHPLCRRHHQAKQAAGWQLAQPRPGDLTWTLPSGRQYHVTAEPYPV